MVIEAPAKANLHLAVLDKRLDGFHNLESLFVTLDFGDIMHFEHDYCEFGDNPGEKAVLDLVFEGEAASRLNIPPEKNIIFKALSLFNEKSISKGGVFFKRLKIVVEKLIPVGGGLGGGSSNAASALLTFNRLAGYPLDHAELLEIGTALGSDVPFFLHEIPAARVTGRGEGIIGLDPPPWHFALVNPGFPSDTARAFRLLDEYRSANSYRKRYEQKQKKEEKVCGYSYSSWLNDFLPVFPEPEKSTYEKIIRRLICLGAEFAGLSGAGSTCFGLFTEKDQADKAALSLGKEWEFAQSCSVKNFC